MPQYGSSHNIVFSLIDVKCYIIPIWFSLFTCFILIFLWMLMKNFFDISPALGTLLFASYLLRFILCFSHYPICNCRSCSGRTVCDASQIKPTFFGVCSRPLCCSVVIIDCEQLYATNVDLLFCALETRAPPRQRLLFNTDCHQLWRVNWTCDILWFPNPLVKFLMLFFVNLLIKLL